MIRTLSIVLSLAALAAPLPAAAQTVGLAPFSGPRNRQVRRVVRDALEERVTVVDVEEGDTGDVDAVVTGSLRGGRSRPRLTLTLTDASGAERASERLRVTMNRRGIRQVSRAVGALLDEAGELGSAEPAPAPDPVVEDDPDPAATDDGADEPEDRDEPGAAPSTDRMPFLHLLVGLSLRNRDLSVQLMGARVIHAVPFYPEVIGEARVRPLAGSGDRMLAGIYARVRFAYALFFESETPSAQVIGGAAWSLEGDAGYLAPLDDQGIVELGGIVGGGFTSYGLDDNAFVPTVDYGTFEVRAATRIRASEEVLVIRAEAGYRLGLGSGPLADAHGSIVGHGIVVEGGVEGMIPFDENVGLSYLAAIEWQNRWLSFSDPAATELATGGNEQYVRGRFAVGVAFR